MPYIPPKYDMHGNSLALTGYTPQASASEALMNYDDFYKKYTGYKVNPYGLAGKIDNFFTGKETSARQAYENYLADYEYKRNKEETSAQNALTFAREDSQIQRLLEDYKKAGLNPYALLSGGNLSSGVVSSQAEKTKYKRSSFKKSDKGDDASKVITSAIRAIAVMAMLAG